MKTKINLFIISLFSGNTTPLFVLLINRIPAPGRQRHTQSSPTFVPLSTLNPLESHPHQHIQFSLHHHPLLESLPPAKHHSLLRSLPLASLRILSANIPTASPGYQCKMKSPKPKTRTLDFCFYINNKYSCFRSWLIGTLDKVEGVLFRDMLDTYPLS